VSDQTRVQADKIAIHVELVVPAEMGLDPEGLADAVLDAIDEFDKADRLCGARMTDGSSCLLSLSVEVAGIEHSTFPLQEDVRLRPPYWDALSPADETRYRRITESIQAEIDALDEKLRALTTAYYSAKRAPDERWLRQAEEVLRRHMASAEKRSSK